MKFPTRPTSETTNQPPETRFTVSEAAGLIQSALASGLPASLEVVGQISNLSCRNHWFFTLKDEEATLSCVAWASVARSFTMQPEDGDQVIATGQISHYGPQGRTQLYVSKIMPVGVGALQQRFEALCKELRASGYFDQSIKKPLATFPSRIAVITSASSAAIQDVISTAAKRFAGVELVIVDVPVQGASAAPAIAAAIAQMDAQAEARGLDGILVTRGGGSVEDLWAFNERQVADAVFACHLPVVAAIGHESDTTIIELVADVRAATPTQAVMLMVPERDAWQQQLEFNAQRLRRLVEQSVERGGQRLAAITRHAFFRDPQGQLHPLRSRVSLYGSRLAQSMQRRLAIAQRQLDHHRARLTRRSPMAQIADQKGRLATATVRLRQSASQQIAGSKYRVMAASGRLDALSPNRVLARGYSLTEDEQGHVLRSTTGLSVGARLTTRLAQGKVESRVEKTTGSEHSEDASAAVDIVSQSRKPQRSGPPPQMDLFDGSK